MEITNNGKQFLTGDETSIKMVFNNLTGRNIYGVLYHMYMNFAKSEGLQAGEICLVNNGTIIETAKVY